MESGGKLPDTQSEIKRAKDWIFSAWYNERYRSTTSNEEIQFCIDKLRKCEKEAVQRIVSKPELYFPEDEINHLKLSNLKKICTQI